MNEQIFKTFKLILNTYRTMGKSHWEILTYGEFSLQNHSFSLIKKVNFTK